MRRQANPMISVRLQKASRKKAAMAVPIFDFGQTEDCPLLNRAIRRQGVTLENRVEIVRLCSPRRRNRTIIVGNDLAVGSRQVNFGELVKS